MGEWMPGPRYKKSVWRNNSRPSSSSSASCGQRVRGLARLADGDHQMMFSHDRIAVAKFAAVIHFHRQMRQPLNHEFPGQCRVPAGSASDDLHTFKIPELLLADIHLVQKHFARVLRNSSQQSVAHRARLLEDFLLHE